MPDKPITLGHDATGHEPQVGKIELFPDSRTPAIDHTIDSLKAASVTANDMLAAMRNQPQGGSFMPDRSEALKRERNYQLLQAAAIMVRDDKFATADMEAITRATLMLEEIERRNP